jgi:hypothetical protein
MMKGLFALLVGLILLLSMSSYAMSESYWVHGADNAEAINGLYGYYGTYNTPKTEGQYSDLDMPVYKKTDDDYYIAYRGCSTKWVIVRSLNPPEYFDGTPGEPTGGYFYINATDSPTPPETGWAVSSHPERSPEPVPTLSLVYKLTLTTAGSGDVTPDDSGIPGFPGYYTADTTVQLTASPDTGWGFKDWSGDLTSTNNPENITMNADKDVTATFEGLADYDLLVTILGSGTVSLTQLDPPNGTVQIPPAGGGTYYDGTLVGLTATPDPYWAFTGWSGDLTGDANAETLTMDANKNVTATFSLKDSDGDGVSDQDEDAGPNGGDANGDGIPDKKQPNVVSAQTADGQNDVVFVLEDPPGATLINCKATANPHPADCPSYVEFPYGFFEITIEGVGAGGRATIEVHLPAGGIQDTFYQYGPTPDDPTDHWYNFMLEPSTQTGAEIDDDVITLHFVDGQRGDHDLDGTNGTIHDPGGPGVMYSEETLIGPTGGGGGTTGGGSSSAIGGCFVETVSR